MVAVVGWPVANPEMFLRNELGCVLKAKSPSSNSSKPGQVIKLFESRSGQQKKVHLPHKGLYLPYKDNIKKDSTSTNTESRVSFPCQL